MRLVWKAMTGWSLLSSTVSGLRHSEAASAYLEIFKIASTGSPQKVGENDSLREDMLACMTLPLEDTAPRPVGHDIEGRG